MKTGLVAVVFAVLVIGASIVPVMAQGVTTGFAVHIGFVYPHLALYNLQVTVNDQTGRVVATGLSPDGSELILGIRTETPIYALTIRASGYASFGSYPYPYILYPIFTSNPYWAISGISSTIVSIVGGDYWITVIMTKS